MQHQLEPDPTHATHALTCGSVDPLAPPTRAQAARAVRSAELLFARTLAGWTLDLLDLRRRGLADARWRSGHARPAFRSAA